jgi:hypothetical protein
MRTGIDARVVLGLILAVFLMLKLTYNPYPIGDFGRDGSFYYQVARHVAEGEGLKTSVALYHQGLKHLPSPSTIYPIWPLLLGGVGAVVGLDLAASLLPEIFYFIDLVLLYALANAIASTWGEKAPLLFKTSSLFNIGHVAVILMGANRNFFRYTSLPFTESLAFCFTFAALLALIKASHRHHILWSALAGALAALAYLTRAQMLGLVVAVPFALLVVGIKDRKYRRAAAVAMAVAVIVSLLWIVYLLTAVNYFAPRMLLDFTAYRETFELAPFKWVVEKESFWEFLKDRASGFLVAFDPNSRFSYVRYFGLSAYLPLLAFLYLFMRPKALGSSMRGGFSPSALGVVGTSLAALGCLVPVHAMHADRWGGWFFQFRQGLPFILAIVVAAAFLLARDHYFPRVVVLSVVGLSMLTSFNWIRKELEVDYPAPTVAQKELATWIALQDPQPVFVATLPWDLAAITRGRFHQVECEESNEQMMIYFRQLKVDHVITHSFDADCPFFTNVKRHLIQVREFGQGSEQIVVWSVGRK